MEDSMDIIKLVDDLNILLYEQLEGFLDSYPIYFYYHTDGAVEAIKFLDIQIWNSDNDERRTHPIYEDGVVVDEEYEPLRDYINREVNTILRTLSTVVFEVEKERS